MDSRNKAKLEELGLPPAEAQIYLTLLRHGPLTAAALANEARTPRTSIYPIIRALTEKGLLEGGAGYRSKFAAIAPDDALPSLIAREKETIAERERLAEELAETLAPLTADTADALDDTVQVLRTRHLILERWQRFQLETKRSIQSLVKAPFLRCGGNRSQKKAQTRGVHYQACYEEAALEDPNIKPYLAEWIANGEEARVFEGELPCKLWISDLELVMLTIARRSGQPSAMFFRHAPFARSISILFEHFWQQAKPLTLKDERVEVKKISGGSAGLTKPKSRARRTRRRA